MEASVLTEHYGRSIRADLGVIHCPPAGCHGFKKKKDDDYKTGKRIHKASGACSEPGWASIH
jgi:hypothetical protein